MSDDTDKEESLDSLVRAWSTAEDAAKAALEKRVWQKTLDLARLATAKLVGVEHLHDRDDISADATARFITKLREGVIKADGNPQALLNRMVAHQISDYYKEAKHDQAGASNMFDTEDETGKSFVAMLAAAQESTVDPDTAVKRRGFLEMVISDIEHDDPIKARLARIIFFNETPEPPHLIALRDEKIVADLDAHRRKPKDVVETDAPADHTQGMYLRVSRAKQEVVQGLMDLADQLEAHSTNEKGAVVSPEDATNAQEILNLVGDMYRSGFIKRSRAKGQASVVANRGNT